MYRLFNPENKFWIFISKLADVACMSILWLICSLPIFTIGAATTAFYAFTLRQVNDTEGGVWKSFFEAFKHSFRKSSLIWLIQVLITAFLCFDLYSAWNFYSGTGSVISLIALSMIACISLIFLGMLQYVYPLLAAYDFPLKKIISDSFILAVGNLPVTIVLFLLLAIFCILFYFLSGLFFFWIGFMIFFSSFFISGVFRKYASSAHEEDNE